MFAESGSPSLAPVRPTACTTMSIIDTPAHQARWLATARQLVLTLQTLEQEIAIALAQRPASTTMLALADADTHLGAAARELQAAATIIRSLTP
jgi:hypothetical protein